MKKMSYRQPSKNIVREKIWDHAVKVLSVKTSESLIVREDEVKEVIDYSVKIINSSICRRKDVYEEFRNWKPMLDQYTKPIDRSHNTCSVFMWSGATK